MRLTLLLFLLLFISTISYAQLINGYALTAGVSYGNQKFMFSNPSAIEHKNYLLGYNGSFFIEFSNADFVRWVTEVQYNEKGSIDKQLAGNYKNKLQYGCFNNYLKIRRELISCIPYILLGPRIDFMVNQGTSSPAITDRFQDVHVSFAAGLGVEFISYGDLKFFIESFYNPDITDAYKLTSLKIQNKNFELRIGLKYVTGDRRRGCNVPR
jgi:hypothetical protein